MITIAKEAGSIELKNYFDKITTKRIKIKEMDKAQKLIYDIEQWSFKEAIEIPNKLYKRMLNFLANNNNNLANCKHCGKPAPLPVCNECNYGITETEI